MERIFKKLELTIIFINFVFIITGVEEINNEFYEYSLVRNTNQPVVSTTNTPFIETTTDVTGIIPKVFNPGMAKNETKFDIENTSYTHSNFGFITIGTLTVLTSLVTVCGNILVLSAFFIERSLRSATNYFIASLAITDILIGIFSMNLYSYYLLMNKWNLGDIACDLWLALDYTACLTSQYTVFLITLDRFFSVKIPTKYRNWRTDSKVLCMVFITWIIPTLVFFTIIFGWPIFYPDTERNSNNCDAPFSQNAKFMTILTICYFWITLVVMFCLYGGIYRVAVTLQKKADAKRQKLTSLFSMAGQTMSRIGVSLPQNESNNNAENNSKYDSDNFYICSKFNTNSSDRQIGIGTKPSFTSSPSSTMPSAKTRENNSIEIVHDECSSMNCFQQPHSCEVEWETVKEKHPPTFVTNKRQLCHVINSPLLIEEEDEDNVSGVLSKKTSLRVKFQNSKNENFQQQKFSFNSDMKISQSYDSNELSTIQSSNSPVWRSRPNESDSDNYRSIQNSEMSFLLDSPRSSSKTLKQILNKNQSSVSCQLLINRPRKSIYKEMKSYCCLPMCQNRREEIQRGRNENRARKALRTISFILGAFVICWTPYHIVVLINAYHPNFVNEHIFNLSYWLCYMNSPINPFCYALANAQFKKTFLRILTCDINKT